MSAGISLDFEAGKRLVSTARRSVERVVTTDESPAPPEAYPTVLDEERGAFVTLRKAGTLRGCIGEPYATQPLIDSVVSAAIGAATRDPRFPPVREAELEAITVEVSALTSPVRIEAASPDAIVEAIEVGTHGLIVDAEDGSGLLLPQVAAERGWDAEAFLAETCRKAGLPTDRWRTDDVTVQQFTVDRFEERDPRGEIVADDLLDG